MPNLTYEIDDFIINLGREGAREFSKVSFPIRYGHYSEIQTPDHVFQFNMNGEIKHVQGRSQNWPHPAEWLKRTVANDWVYYSAGDYKGVYEILGEYYYPYFSYASNSILDEDPFADGNVKSAVQSWRLLQPKMKELASKKLDEHLQDFLASISQKSDEVLSRRSMLLHRLIGGQVTVLPPDTRHVDYEIIPLMVADGCLYNCGFCRVKSGQSFSPRTLANIIEQIEALKRFYGRDLHNYNSVFLGQHDGLGAGREILESTALTAYQAFDFEHSYIKNAKLFLFGSVHSFLDAKPALFESLNSLPFYSYINIGLESADLITLTALRKPVAVGKVHDAFSRILEINRNYERIEVTANFVYGDDLPSGHLPSFLDLVQARTGFIRDKGTLYLSPMVQSENGKKRNKRDLLRKFYKVKAQSPLPTYLYLIQRL